jgi:putative FmdB family regulatory protein
MPKYEYACKSCGEHLEVVQSFTDAPPTECPACGGPLRRVFSAPGIAFKGSGFYRTDNRKRRQEPKVDAKAEAGSKADAGSTAGAGSEAGGGSAGAAKDAPAKSEPASAPAAQSKAAQSKAAQSKAGESKPKAAEAKTA